MLIEIVGKIESYMPFSIARGLVGLFIILIFVGLFKMFSMETRKRKTKKQLNKIRTLNKNS